MSDLLNSEQLISLSLLFEQFAATIHNRNVELARLRAERISMQKDKLSVLGLIAGSLAHEIRNPLSSMRTITSLMLEECGESRQMQNDLRVILGEIDRLSLTTLRLLDYSRPASEDHKSVNAGVVIDRLLQILSQLARQHNVELRTQLEMRPVRVMASDAILSEILFNLIRNAIEAVREQSPALVEILTELDGDFLLIRIADNGPGVADAVRDSLFQPFVTSKPDGTGLGLYVVAERVRELQGTIACRTHSDSGTVFDVRLPVDKTALADRPDDSAEVTREQRPLP